MADARIEILLDEPIGRIAPEIYGHFVEHLGGVVYDGIWVGEDSKVPNIGGVRQAIVEAMKRIKASVIRWPGGVSPTATTGATASASQRPPAPSELLDRRAEWPVMPTARGNTTQIISGPMNSCASAS